MHDKSPIFRFFLLGVYTYIYLYIIEKEIIENYWLVKKHGEKNHAINRYLANSIFNQFR